MSSSTGRRRSSSTGPCGARPFPSPGRARTARPRATSPWTSATSPSTRPAPPSPAGSGSRSAPARADGGSRRYHRSRARGFSDRYGALGRLPEPRTPNPEPRTPLEDFLTRPELSVVVPALDEERVIGRTLRRLARQVPPGSEILVADGGSRDRTVEIASRWARVVPCQGEGNDPLFRATGFGVRGSGVLSPVARPPSPGRCQRPPPHQGEGKDPLPLPTAGTPLAKQGSCQRPPPLPSGRGRGPQLNRGAAEAQGRVLLFLHADVRLSDGAIHAALSLLDRGRADWGTFRMRILGRHPFYRSIEFFANVRARALRLAYGDTGLFVSADLFRAAGGYPEWPIFEDAGISARLRPRGRFRALPHPILVSARRWERQGIARTTLANAWLQTRYFAGENPTRLARLYSTEPGAIDTATFPIPAPPRPPQSS
ncbi:MAG: glycosyltransferase [Planctomycetes bacterium]|nr:glycosyltransferase [Planctomycetota bacterium]